jgi:23S rRNA (cytosine1962-C5)-methyltransferase
MGNVDGPDTPESAVLVDCGDGRRLDRLGPYLIVRPAPAAPWAPRDPAVWAAPDAEFVRESGTAGRWIARAIPGDRWEVSTGGLRLELRLAGGGQVGLFLEQRAIWSLVRRLVAEADAPRVLNLFAYTGGTSLAAGSAGAAVVHVDASRTATAWARRNAELCGLADAPIRWIVDDAEAFVRREARRGNRYDVVVLDPPSYGHAGTRRSWLLADRLPELLAASARILARGATLLVTAHTPGYDSGRLADEAVAALAGRDGGPRGAAALPPGATPLRRKAATIVEAGPLDLRAASGAVLPSGAFAAVAAR